VTETTAEEVVAVGLMNVVGGAAITPSDGALIIGLTPLCTVVVAEIGIRGLSEGGR